MNKRILTTSILFLLVLAMALAGNFSRQGYYPFADMVVPGPSGNVDFDYLFNKLPTLQDCELVNGKLARQIFVQCPKCRITRMACAKALDPGQLKLMSQAPVDTPSGRANVGVIRFKSADAHVALVACQKTERATAKTGWPVTCYGPGEPRPIVSSPLNINFLVLGVLLAAFAVSGLCGWLIIQYEDMHGHLSHDHVTDGPQKVHALPTPRIGGVMLLAGLLSAGGVLMFAESLAVKREFGFLLLASAPAFLGGLIEDVTKKVGVLDRLLLTMLSGAIAAWLLGAVLDRLDVPMLDQAMQWMPFAVLFTCIAVGGVSNAINIIDGFNGLSAGFSVIVLMPLAWVAYWVGDGLVFACAVAMTGALLGFLIWNWPHGKIFLGDGGAYLLGFLLAELCVLLLVRNPSVTPWFALLLFIHPVFETLYSIFRRKVLRGHSPGHPDGIHLHTLIYKRIVPREAPLGMPFSKLERNSRVAKYIWIAALATALYGALLWKSTAMMAFGVFAYCLCYIFMYRRIVTWRSGGFSFFAHSSRRPGRSGLFAG